MDVFKFTNPNSPTKMESGELINGLKTKMWVERYGPPGEFTFVAPAWTNIREQLPIGTFISHTNTKEIMIVENHEVQGKKNEEIMVTITGRSFDSFFENRVVGSNQIFPAEYTDYVLEEDYSWNQLVELIQDHILPSRLKDPNDALPYVSVGHSVPSISGEVVERLLSRGDLSEHISDLLKVDNLGIKTVRPYGGSENVSVVIHKGVDRTEQFVFSYSMGELENIDYLFSKKKERNAALVTSKWVEVMVAGPEVGIERKTMFVSAPDIDSEFEEPPTGEDLETITAVLEAIGTNALADQNEVALKQAELSQTSPKFIYRQDYDLGDLVSVSGGYLTNVNEPSTMRIVEYVETEDETGSKSYPTLALDPLVA